VTNAGAAYTHHLRVAPQELRVFWRAVQKLEPVLPRLLTLHALYVPGPVLGRSSPFKDTDGMAIVYCEIETSARLQNALELQKPSFHQVVEVRKNRARVNKIKGVFGKG
jgi:hypothetical protein